MCLCLLYQLSVLKWAAEETCLPDKPRFSSRVRLRIVKPTPQLLVTLDGEEGGNDRTIRPDDGAA